MKTCRIRHKEINSDRENHPQKNFSECRHGACWVTLLGDLVSEHKKALAESNDSREGLWEVATEQSEFRELRREVEIWANDRVIQNQWPKKLLKSEKPPHGNHKSNCFVRRDTKWSSVLLTKSPGNLRAVHNSYEIAKNCMKLMKKIIFAHKKQHKDSLFLTT